MEIRTDKRCIRAVAEPAAEEAVDRSLQRLRDVQVEAARAFATVDESAHFVLSGCASIVEWGIKRGYGAGEVRLLTNLGKTLAAMPEMEALVRSGAVTVAAASDIGRILGCPNLVREGDDWAGWAERDPLKVLRRRIKERVELVALGAAQGETGITEITVFVREKTKDDFERAKEVASSKARKPLSDGQVFARITDFYLEKNDPLRKGAGRKRRVGPTAHDPESRYVPAEVARALWKRSNGTCEIPDCPHRRGIQMAHRHPHRAGSGREVEDLVHLCPRHHTLYDAGKITLPGVEELARAPNGSPQGADPPGADPPGADPPGADPPGADPPGEASGNASLVCERSLQLQPSRQPASALTAGPTYALRPRGATPRGARVGAWPPKPRLSNRRSRAVHSWRRAGR